MQLLQSGNLVVGLAHGKHLDYAFVGEVAAVFCASVALGYPHGVVLLRYDEAYVVRQVA